MSFIRITQTNTDNAYIRLHPSRSFSSSSAGVTGSVRVIAQSSPFVKEVTTFSPFVDSPVDDSSLEEARADLFALTASGIDITGSMESYLSKVSEASQAAPPIVTGKQMG